MCGCSSFRSATPHFCHVAPAPGPHCACCNSWSTSAPPPTGRAGNRAPLKKPHCICCVESRKMHEHDAPAGPDHRDHRGGRACPVAGVDVPYLHAIAKLVGDSRNAPVRTVPVGVRGTEEFAAGMNATLDLVRDGSVAQSGQEQVGVRVVADKVTMSQQRGNEPRVRTGSGSPRSSTLTGRPKVLRRRWAMWQAWLRRSAGSTPRACRTSKRSAASSRPARSDPRPRAQVWTRRPGPFASRMHSWPEG